MLHLYTVELRVRWCLYGLLFRLLFRKRVIFWLRVFFRLDISLYRRFIASVKPGARGRVLRQPDLVEWRWRLGLQGGLDGFGPRQEGVHDFGAFPQIGCRVDEPEPLQREPEVVKGVQAVLTCRLDQAVDNGACPRPARGVR